MVGPCLPWPLIIEGISKHSRAWQGQGRQKFFTTKLDRGCMIGETSKGVKSMGPSSDPNFASSSPTGLSAITSASLHPFSCSNLGIWVPRFPFCKGSQPRFCQWYIHVISEKWIVERLFSPKGSWRQPHEQRCDLQPFGPHLSSPSHSCRLWAWDYCMWHTASGWALENPLI